MYTRKDYVRAVEIIRDGDYAPEQHAAVTTAFLAFFSDDNPRFDGLRFLVAATREVK